MYPGLEKQGVVTDSHAKPLWMLVHLFKLCFQVDVKLSLWGSEICCSRVRVLKEHEKECSGDRVSVLASRPGLHQVHAVAPQLPLAFFWPVEPTALWCACTEEWRVPLAWPGHLLMKKTCTQGDTGMCSCTPVCLCTLKHAYVHRF